MIKVRDVTISDLLPYTMKTPKNIALSKAFGEMTRYLYGYSAICYILGGY